MVNAKVSGKGNDWPNPAPVTTIDLLRMKTNSMIEVVVTVWRKLYPNCIVKELVKIVTSRLLNLMFIFYKFKMF